MTIANNRWNRLPAREWLGSHITLRLADGRVIAASRAARRLAARCITRVGAARGLLVFSVVDTHIHLVALGGRAQAGALARLIESALRRVLLIPVPFESARLVEVADQSHLASAVRYVLRQQGRHEAWHDELYDGSSLPDLLGWRALDVDGAACTVRVRAELPRLAGAELWELVRAQGGVLDVRGSPPRLARTQLADAAAGAFGLAHVGGSSLSAVRARAAAVHAAVTCGRGSLETAELLGMSRRAVQRVRQQPVEAATVTAVGWQLAVRAALQLQRAADVPTSWPHAEPAQGSARPMARPSRLR